MRADWSDLRARDEDCSSFKPRPFVLAVSFVSTDNKERSLGRQ